MALNKSEKIAIIGNGFAGLAAALIVARAGYEVVLIGPKETGPISGGFQLAPNGLNALSRLGLNDLCNHALPLQAINLARLKDGVELAHLDHAAHQRDYKSFSRQAFEAGLRDAVGQMPNIEPIASRVKAVACDQKPARLVLDDGQLITADIVIGADGLMGKSRRLVAPLSTADQKTKAIILRAEINAADLPAVMRQSQTRLWMGDGCHLVHYPIAKGPGSSDLSVNLVLTLSANKPDLLNKDTEMLLAYLFGHHPVLASMRAHANNWHRSALADAPVPDVWRRGQLFLIGDAAHVMPPHLAQGIGQTLMDVDMLAQCLQHEPISIALSQMVRARMADIQMVARRAAQAGAALRFSGQPARLRDLMVGTSGAVLESWLEQIWTADT